MSYNTQELKDAAVAKQQLVVDAAKGTPAIEKAQEKLEEIKDAEVQA
jgi:hypothetical protein